MHRRRGWETACGYLERLSESLHSPRTTLHFLMHLQRIRLGEERPEDSWRVAMGGRVRLRFEMCGGTWCYTGVCILLGVGRAKVRSGPDLLQAGHCFGCHTLHEAAFRLASASGWPATAHIQYQNA